MLKLSISIEGWQGLTWPRWQRLILEVERLGFAGLYLSDHFNTSGTLDANSLELVVALTYLADHTKRVHFGSLVSPLSFRDPVLLARQAAAIDDLSEGRMILGLGAGWEASEHTMFGYSLGDIPTRMDRLGEGLAVVTGLLRNDEPLNYTGRFYQLRDALLAGPRRVGSPQILVGGSGPKRTLPLVARYADIWNAQLLSAHEFEQHSLLLDKLLHEVGRPPQAVRRTIALMVFCGRTESELAKRGHWLRSLNLEWGDAPMETIFASLRPMLKSLITGSPEEVLQQIGEYWQAGVTELVIQWGDLDDIEGLNLLAAQVLRPLLA